MADRSLISVLTKFSTKLNWDYVAIHKIMCIKIYDSSNPLNKSHNN